MPLLDELLVGLGFDYDPDELKQFNKDVDKSINIVKKLVQVVVAGATALTAMTIASTAASDEQGKLADEVGDTVENIDALQFATKRAGGTADGMTDSLRQLSIRAAEAARGTGTGVEAFGLLGISATDASGRVKSASDLMLEVSGRMQSLTKAQQIELADKLGLRNSIRLLQQGPKEIRNLIKEAKALGVTTSEDAFIAAEFQDALTDLWQITKQITRTISRVMAPILSGIIGLFVDWWKATRDIIRLNMPNFVNQLTSAFKLLAIAVGAFIAFRLVMHFIQLVSLLRAATLASLAMSGVMFLLPALIALIAAGFIALIEDAKVFFEGGESFIGDMLKKYPAWANEISIVASVLATVAELTSLIFDGWSKIFDLFDKFSADNIKEVFNNLPGFLGDITGIQDTEGKGFLNDIKNFISGEDNANIPNNVNRNISNASNTRVDKIDIVVQGGADTADNIANSVFNIFQQTSQDLNSAVEQ